MIFSRIRRLGLIFGFKILNFNILWGFQKNKYFLGVRRFCGYFLGSSQNWASFRFISMHLRVFFKVKDTELGYFLGLLKLQIFFGVLDIPDIFWGVR